MLTPKQIRFCEEFLVDLNGTQAAIRAGYSKKTANEQASQLLAKLSIQDYLGKLRNELSERTAITAEAVVRELALVGFANLEDFANVTEQEVELPTFGEDDPDSDEEDTEQKPTIVKQKIVDVFTSDKVPKDRKGALAGIKQGRYGIELKLHDKVKALELLGRHLGVFERDNSQKKPDAQPFSDAQVDKLITELRKKKS